LRGAATTAKLATIAANGNTTGISTTTAAKASTVAAAGSA
jgi:hypothetical protein